MSSFQARRLLFVAVAVTAAATLGALDLLDRKGSNDDSLVVLISIWTLPLLGAFLVAVMPVWRAPGRAHRAMTLVLAVVLANAVCAVIYGVIRGERLQSCDAVMWISSYWLCYLAALVTPVLVVVILLSNWQRTGQKT